VTLSIVRDSFLLLHCKRHNICIVIIYLNYDFTVVSNYFCLFRPNRYTFAIIKSSLKVTLITIQFRPKLWPKRKINAPSGPAESLDPLPACSPTSRRPPRPRPSASPRPSKTKKKRTPPCLMDKIIWRYALIRATRSRKSPNFEKWPQKMTNIFDFWPKS